MLGIHEATGTWHGIPQHTLCCLEDAGWRERVWQAGWEVWPNIFIPGLLATIPALTLSRSTEEFPPMG